MDVTTIYDPDFHGTKTPDKDGRIYLTESLAKEPVHVWAVRADRRDGMTEGALATIRGVAANDDLDPNTRQALLAAVGALARDVGAVEPGAAEEAE